MYASYERLIRDTRLWLGESRPKLTRKNPAKKFGVVLHASDIQVQPKVGIQAFELRTMIKGDFLYGGIQIVAVGVDGLTEKSTMAWDRDNIAFESPLIGTEGPHLINRLPGVVLERIYPQFAIPISKALSAQ